MENQKAVKMSYIVNTVLLTFVLGLAGFFYLCKAESLVIFSIPTICVYLINYLFIKLKKLNLFVWLTYFWITLYMSYTTIALGFNMGFHLYSLSLILVLFCTDYMAYKLNGSATRAVLISCGIALIYMCSTAVAVWNGPIYKTSKIYSNIMLVLNAGVVFTFIITYAKILINMIIKSESELTRIAHYDKLTNLYNRHFMMDALKEESELEGSWIALLDIDDFKNINDTYGHNAGDYVLVHLAEILKSVCGKCTISRWGGEEFLVLCKDKSVETSIMEKLRSEICKEPFSFEGTDIKVSMTIGVSVYEASRSADKWIQSADQKLYAGKNSGKNVVVY